MTFKAEKTNLPYFARQLDVPPEVIPRWLAARDAMDRDQLLQTEATARVARGHADLSDAIAQINMKLAEPNLGMQVFAQLTQQKTRLIEQRAKLLEKHDLDKISVDPRDDGTKAIHSDLAELCAAFMEAKDTLEAAGIDPDFPATPEEIAAARAEYDYFRAEFPRYQAPRLPGG